MDADMQRPDPRLVGIVAAVAATAAAGGVLSFVLRGAPLTEMFRAWIPHNAPIGIVGTLGIAAVLRRRPTNRAARFLFASSVAGAVHVVAVSTFYGLLDRHPALDAAVAAGEPLPGGAIPLSLAVPLFVFSWVWVVSVSLAMVWGLPLVPDGRWPRGRWRWIERVGLLGMVLAVVGWGWAGLALPGRRIPVNEPGDLGVIGNAVLGAGTVLLGVAALGSVAAIVVRLRRAAPQQRRELRPVGVTVLLFLVSVVALYPWQQLWAATVAVTMVLMITTISLSLARGRLFDVEVVVSRAVAVALLAAFVTIAYVGIVVGVGALVGDSDNLVLALVATAVVAVAFEPLRHRTTRWARRMVTGAQATPEEVLAQLSDRLARADSTDEVLARVLELLLDGTGAVAALVRVPDGGGWSVVASTDGARDPEAEQTADIVNEGEVLGQVRLLADRPDHLDASDRRLLSQVAGTLGPVLRNKALTGELTRTIEQLSASRERLVLAEETVRRTIERDIHDGAQQRLLALRIKLGLATTLAEQESDRRVADVVADAAEDTDGAIRSLRDLARGTYPPILEQEGLAAALRSRLRDVPMETRLHAEDVGRHDPRIEAAVYFCCLEAIQNATKHAGASRVGVTLRRTDGHLAFTVSDDGEGFDPDSAARGRGLTNMADRIEGLGGTLTVSSDPEAGSRVRGRVPVRTGAADPAGAVRRRYPSASAR